MGFLQIIAFLWSNRALIMEVIALLRGLFDSKDEAKEFLAKVSRDENAKQVLRDQVFEVKRTMDANV